MSASTAKSTRARRLRMGACRIINIKLGRVGGYSAARRIHDLCREKGVPVWCGGMLESGIGRAHNIALSTLANFTLPGDVTASRRYWTEDIIEPEVTVSAQGTISAPGRPGHRLRAAARAHRISHRAARGVALAPCPPIPRFRRQRRRSSGRPTPN